MRGWWLRWHEACAGAWLALPWLAVGCSSEPAVDGAADPAAGRNAEVALAGGDPDGFDLTTLHAAPGLIATDLAFNPAHDGELWAVFRQAAYVGAPCNSAENPNADPPYDRAACDALEGSVAVIERATSGAPLVTALTDANAWHFMRLPSGIAFADNDEFATSAEARTGNWDDGEADFIGPTLWSADPAVFGPPGPGGNGSHLDMLHASPFAMGIEHERDRVYWVVNGQAGAVDRYDFVAPHEPGGAFHGDGSATRFLNGELRRVPGIPSHLAFHDRFLYVADTGNGRVIRFDTTSGGPGSALPAADDQLGGQIEVVVNSVVEVVVPPGVLEAPSGLAVAGGVVYVTDNATGVVTAFDAQGTVIVSVDTGLGAGELAGIDFGPDGRAYLALLSGSIVRIDPR